jgi:hypothetical protein
MNKILLFLVVTTFTCGAHAIPMSYSYTSGALSPSGAAVPAVTNISLTFTADLAGGLVQVDSGANVSAWTVDDGFTMLGSANPGPFVLDEFFATTDPSGLITGFLFRLFRIPVPIAVGELFDMVIVLDAAGGSLTLASTRYCAITTNEQCDDDAPASSRVLTGGVVSDVPLPTTLALFGLGLAGIGISRRKRTTQG